MDSNSTILEELEDNPKMVIKYKDLAGLAKRKFMCNNYSMIITMPILLRENVFLELEDGTEVKVNIGDSYRSEDIHGNVFYVRSTFPLKSNGKPYTDYDITHSMHKAKYEYYSDNEITISANIYITNRNL